MNWQRDMHLTTEQIEFVKCAGGSVKITSHVSGAMYNYLIQTTSRGKGLIVKHIENNNQHYVGYLPFNGHGMARDGLVHTQASEYGTNHEIFRAFAWAWANKHTDNFESKCLLTNI
jgi:hypothetical protein